MINHAPSEHQIPYALLPNGEMVPWDTPPASRVAAVAERSTLIQEIKDIEMRLGTREPASFAVEADYQAWRGRALYARRAKERRAMFLRQWLRDNPPPAPAGCHKRHLQDMVIAIDEYAGDRSSERWETVLGEYREALRSLGREAP